MTMDSTNANWSSKDASSDRTNQPSVNAYRDVDFAQFDRQRTTQSSTASQLLPSVEISSATGSGTSNADAAVGNGQIGAIPAPVSGDTPAQLAKTNAQSLASQYENIQSTAVNDIYGAARNDTLSQFASFLPTFESDSAPALSAANATSDLLQGIGQPAIPGGPLPGAESAQYSSALSPQPNADSTAEADAAKLTTMAEQFQNQGFGDIQNAASNFTNSQFNSYLQNLSADYATDLNGTTTSVPPEQPQPPVVVPPGTPQPQPPETPQPPVVVPPGTPQPQPPETPQPPVVVPPGTPQPQPPETPQPPVVPPGTPQPSPPETPTGSPGQGLYIDGKLTGMTPDVNLADATNLGKLGNLAGVDTAPGWNPSQHGVVQALATKDNGTFSVTVENPWNQNGHKGAYTMQVPIPDEGLAALEQQASKTNSDGKVIIEDTANGQYYDFWEGQNIAPNGQSGGKATTFMGGALDNNGTPGSNAAGISEALADTSAASGTHMLLFGAPTDWMSPGNPDLMKGSTSSDVGKAGGALQEGDILQLPQSVADAWIAANPNATAAQLQIIKDMEPTSVGGGGGMVVTSQDGTGWSGDDKAGLWQSGMGVDLTFMNDSNGPNILSNLEVYK